MGRPFSVRLSGLENLRSIRTLVMGIMNATPDSFSDGGELSDSAAIERVAKTMVDSGVDIIDVGGESTRPGHDEVAEAEEIQRIKPVIESIRRVSETIPISIDTRRASVAETALELGANFVNDVSGLSDERMAEVVKSVDCSIVVMQGFDQITASVSDCAINLDKLIHRATKLGISKQQLILDPGIGFVGPDPRLNLELIRHQDQYAQDFPVLIGASRKRFIGKLTAQEDPKARLLGSVAAAVLAAEHGAAIVRVHDVRETIEALKVVE